MQKIVLIIICLLTDAKAGPYAKRPRPVAETPLVAATQWWLQERLLAVEMRMLTASKDVGWLAEETTREAYRLTDEARVHIDELAAGVTVEARRIRPLFPLCANNAEVRRIVGEFNNITLEVLECTHKVSDAAAGFEVSMTVQLNDARGQVWDVQEAMYYCEKFLPKGDAECLRRLTVEGLQIVSKLPDRVRTVLDNALSSRAGAGDRLTACFMNGISAATEKQLAHTQRMRQCKEELQAARSNGPDKE